MDRQARYKPQAENEFFDDGRNDRPIPSGAVARGNYFNQNEVFSEDFVDRRLGDVAFNKGKQPDGSFVRTLPTDVSFEQVEKGRQKYEIFCVSFAAFIDSTFYLELNVINVLILSKRQRALLRRTLSVFLVIFGFFYLSGSLIATFQKLWNMTY